MSKQKEHFYIEFKTKKASEIAQFFEDHSEAIYGDPNEKFKTMSGFVRTPEGYVRVYSQCRPDRPHHPTYARLTFITGGQAYTRTLDKYCGKNLLFDESKKLVRDVLLVSNSETAGVVPGEYLVVKVAAISRPG